MRKEKYIDHTILKAVATKNDVKKLCQEAIKYDFMSVCVNPHFVAYASELLKDSDVLVCTVVGFPLGANTTEVKVFETVDAIKNGADEIDMVINVGELKNGNYSYVEEEIRRVVEASDGKLVKVILETCYLTDEEIKEASLCAKRAKADFVKTSTGFGSAGATVHAVSIMRETVGNEMGVKASGGVRSKADMEDMIKAGANRIGCSAGVQIMEDYKNE